MSRTIFHENIANGNVVSSVCVWHAKPRNLSNVGFPSQRKTMALQARNADRRCCDCVVKLREYYWLRAMLRTKATGSVYCFKAAITVKMVRSLICNTCISLALVCQIARRASQRLTPLRRREKSGRQQAIIDEVRQEILERTRQKTTNVLPRNAKLQRATARLRSRLCAPWCCHRRRCQPGRTVPASAGRENENRCTGTNVHSASCQLARILLQLDFVLHSSLVEGPSRRAKTNGSDGSRPRPAAHIAKRCFLNWI